MAAVRKDKRSELISHLETLLHLIPSDFATPYVNVLQPFEWQGIKDAVRAVLFDLGVNVDGQRVVVADKFAKVCEIEGQQTGMLLTNCGYLCDILPELGWENKDEFSALFLTFIDNLYVPVSLAGANCYISLRTIAGSSQDQPSEPADEFAIWEKVCAVSWPTEEVAAVVGGRSAWLDLIGLDPEKIASKYGEVAAHRARKDAPAVELRFKWLRRDGSMSWVEDLNRRRQMAGEVPIEILGSPEHRHIFSWYASQKDLMSIEENRVADCDNNSGEAK